MQLNLERNDERTVCIYALVDPRDGEVRYVGKARDPLRRIGEHLRDRRECHRVHWLQTLVAEGMVPQIVALEVCMDAAWIACERWWIREMRRLGCALTNGTEGGDGLWHPTPEVRARLSEALASPAGRARQKRIALTAWASPTGKQERIAAARARWADPAVRERHVAGRHDAKPPRPWRHSDEAKRRIAAAHTPEVRAADSERMKQLWADSFWRDQVLEARRGVPNARFAGKRHTPETRERLRQIMLQRYHPKQQGPEA